MPDPGGKTVEDRMHSPSTLTMLPFLSGERSTGYRSGATGALMGLTLGTTPAHVFKACMESVALRLRAVLNLIHQAVKTDSTPRILASGGALESNSLWRQMIANSSGLEVFLDSDTTEGTSRGVALLVSTALTGIEGKGTPSLREEEIKTSLESIPEPPAVAYFNRAAALQEMFLGAVSPMYAA